MRHSSSAQRDDLLRDGSRALCGEPARIADNLITSTAAWSSRPIQLIIIGGTLLIGLTITLAWVLLSSLRDEHIADSKRDLEGVATVLAESLDRTFQSIGLVQTAVIERIQRLGIASVEDLHRQMSDYDTHQDLRHRIDALPYIDAIVLTDPDGHLVNLSRTWPIPSTKVPAEDPAQAFKSDPRLTVFVGEPLQSPVTGTWILPLAHKLSGTNGEFLGVVLGVIRLQYFERLFEAVAGKNDHSIALFNRGGMLIAAHNLHGNFRGQSFSQRAIFRDVLSKSNYGTVQQASVATGEELLISGRNLAHYPMAVVITRSIDKALVGWKNAAIYVIGATSIVATMIGGIFYLSASQVRKTLRSKNLQLDTALNNMSQGLVMFDSTERLIVWNERYPHMYGLPRGFLKPGITLRQLLKYVADTGIVTSDPEEYIANLRARLAQGETVDTFRQLTDGRTIRIANQPMANGGWVGTHEDITNRLAAEQQIARLAHSDALTALPNRALFSEALDEALERVKRGERLALLYLDLDHFKRVNDTLGHLTGDKLLKLVAERLRDCVRGTDFVARLGGDEFAIVQTQFEQPSDIVTLAARIIESIRMPFDLDGHEARVDVSIGISIAPDDAIERDQLVKNADLALYGAKDSGRGTYQFYEARMDLRMKARQKLESDLRNALTHGEFELYYQPIFNLETNKVSSCEALLRWHHPEHGMVPPAEFIPIAEESGIIRPLGEWVLRQACADAANWPDNIKVAVNLSPIQMKGSTLVAMVVSALATSSLSACRLELEITESVLMENTSATLTTLQQLRDLGARIVLDDFGIGYSSLSYLRAFPFNKIKIDRSFIEGVVEKDDCAAIVQAVVDMTRSLKIMTTAEGIETVEQREMVRNLGCTEMQGYLLCRPVPAQDLLQFFSPHIQMTGKASAA